MNLIAHLSHTDLDGYAAQYITRKVSELCGIPALFENTNYGDEILTQFDSLVGRVIDSAPQGPVMFLVTDVNLTVEQCEYFDRQARYLSDAVGHEVRLMLLDHHITGEEAAARFTWYRLDVDACATLLTYRSWEPAIEDNTAACQYLGYVADVVNAVDLWREDDELFEAGNLLSELFSGIDGYVPEVMSELRRDYRHFLIGEVTQLLFSGASLDDVEDMLPVIRRQFIKQYPGLNEESREIMESPDMTTSKKYYWLVYQNLAADLEKGRYQVVEVDGLKGLVLHQLPYGAFQCASHWLLRNDHGLDFVLQSTVRGNLSLRSIGDTDVSALSKRYFNGGGHKNAAGGRLPTREQIRNPEHAHRLVLKALGLKAA
ncbi:hypothetical protein [Thioalkalivibrio thiocyanodenitrificans]|uniref:hypothetical protein n=1 Tax=Thioalkalivibrio thiocyanodenitrificans TaxID=243063 RepID=UPI00035F057A|nr:hypothetical protein [Thioalkalivibrio thiocyanodenitrificans]